MFGIGIGEMVIIGLLGIILFGKNLPSVARTVGRGVREFKKGFDDIREEIKNPDHEEHNQKEVNNEEVKK